MHNNEQFSHSLNNQTLELPEINSKFAHEYFIQIDLKSA